MGKQLLIVKLGGGLITRKDEPFTPRKNIIKLLASEIGELYRNRPEVDILLGNGAGSYAHFTAHEYGLRSGASEPDQFFGASLAHHGVQRLNSMVVDALVNEGVPAFGITPLSMLTSENGSLSSAFTRPVECLIKHRCVPVLPGDIICDTKQGISIFSSEECLHACIPALRGRYGKITVAYTVVDVDGVTDKDGKVIPVLEPGEQVVASGEMAHDVTAGIYGKVETARKSATLADEVYIINGQARGALAKILDGQKIGTKILPLQAG